MCSLNNPDNVLTISGGYTSFRHLGDDLVVRAILASIETDLPTWKPVLLAESEDSIAARFGVETATTATRLINEAPRFASIPTMDDRVDAIVSAAVAAGGSSQTVDPEIVDLVEQIVSAQAYVIAAAGSLCSSYANWELWPRLTEARIAQAANIPVAVVSAGLGPFTTNEHRQAAHALLDIADHIDVRDVPSRELAISLGIDSSRIAVHPDASTATGDIGEAAYREFCAATGIPPDRYVIVCARQSDPPDTLAHVASVASAVAARRSLGVVLMPHVASGADDDGVALQSIADLMRSDVPTVQLADVPPDLTATALIRRAVLTMGTRFHAAVLACSTDRPAVMWSTNPYDRARIGGLAQSHPRRVLEVTTKTRLASYRAVRLAKVRPREPSFDIHTLPMIDWLAGL